MKKTIFIILLIVPFLVIGQEIVINKDGKKIILNDDKTWDYFEIIKSKNDSNNSNSYFGDISDKIISKFLNTNSVDIVKNFDGSNYEVLDYYGKPFSKYSSCNYLIKDINNKTGFLYRSECDMELNNKLDQKNSIEILEKSKPLNIIGTKIEDINSADGVDISITLQYLDKSKDIKYIRFTWVPYNCVGDPVSGRYDNGKKTGVVTGPISASNERLNWHWETMWYNNTICSIKLVKVQVEYMDNTKYTYVNELPKYHLRF